MAREADVCGEALNEAIHRFGAPDIMNTDQGSQFTSFVWTDRLKRVGSRISMDGKGRCIDNVFMERLMNRQLPTRRAGASVSVEGVGGQP